MQRSADESHQEGNLNWWLENKPRVVRFGAWSGLFSNHQLDYPPDVTHLQTVACTIHITEK